MPEKLTESEITKNTIGTPDLSTDTGVKTEPVQANSIEKLRKGIKIVVGGPPHSGKSVFIEALTNNLDKDHTYAMSACPDGEGPWLQKHYDDPDVVALRRKGGFTPEFVDWATKSVQDWNGPLMLVDIGGRTSEENSKIVEGATHAIILAGDISEIPEWKKFFETKGIEVIAVLNSHYLDHKDRFGDPGFLLSDEANDPILASVHHLERGEPAEGRETLQLMAEVIEHLVEKNKANREISETDQGYFKIDVASLRVDLPTTQVKRNLTSGQTITNTNLDKSAVPGLYEKIASQPHDQEVWLDGPTNSWEIVALACALNAADVPGIRYNSPNGFVELQKLPISDEPSIAASGWEWNVTKRVAGNGQKITVVEVAHNPDEPIHPDILLTTTLPGVDTDSIVVLGGKIPQWLRASIALGYVDNCAAIAAFIPGEGSTIAWAKENHAQLLGITVEQMELLSTENKAPSFEAYLEQATSNLLRTSRTAQGEVDTSASATKVDQMNVLGGDETALIARRNFQQAIGYAYEHRDDKIDALAARQLVVQVANQINGGILKDGVLLRQGADSDKYPYTRIAELEPAMTKFYAELADRLSSKDEDPVELAAWVEYNIDLTHHFFADGCGKTAKVISSFVLMRSGLPLPNYTNRDDYFEHAPTKIVGRDPEVDNDQYQTWLAYYRTLF